MEAFMSTQTAPITVTPGVRFEPELLEARTSDCVGSWARAIGAFSRRLPAKKRAEFLLALDSAVYPMQGEAAVAASRDGGDGLHPKHRLMRYHDFFVDRIRKHERVLDLGCGVGALAISIAMRSGADVTGLDLSDRNLAEAKARADLAGVALRTTFECGDITSHRVSGRFDTIVLSNVLEHLRDRAALLQRWLAWYAPTRFLIRVPAFDRDWRVAYKKELGIEWRLDPTHETEYSRAQLDAELSEGGLYVTECLTRWGEYWCEARRA
jgi:SAM-dependent methyltransferase